MDSIQSNILKDESLHENSGATKTVPVVLKTKEEEEEHFRKMMPLKVLVSLCVGQITIFAISLICEILIVMFEERGPRYNFSVGFWCGIFFGIAGSFGLWTVRMPSNKKVLAFMILCTLASVACFPFVVLEMNGLYMNKKRVDYYYDENRRYKKRYQYENEFGRVLVFLYSLVFFLGFIECLLGIVCAILCCRTYCSDNSSSKQKFDFGNVI